MKQNHFDTPPALERKKLSDSGPGSFPVPVARRRTDFSPISAEGAADFTSRTRRMESSQLLKGRSENF
jgi:hypothetical protein